LEKVENKAKTVPQRLKPDCKCGTYGTAEAVPLSKTEYFNKLLGDNSWLREPSLRMTLHHIVGFEKRGLWRYFGTGFQDWISGLDSKTGF
jgi:hypothetical protein